MYTGKQKEHRERFLMVYYCWQLWRQRLTIQRIEDIKTMLMAQKSAGRNGKQIAYSVVQAAAADGENET